MDCVDIPAILIKRSSNITLFFPRILFQFAGQIDGELTLDENIADNGGLREAYYAYKIYVEKNGKEQLLPGLEHYTHEQLLFISYGNVCLSGLACFHRQLQANASKINHLNISLSDFYSLKLWCETQTTIATKWALEDTHCPGRVRLKGVLDNSEEFKNAFNCRPPPRVPSKERCRIW